MEWGENHPPPAKELCPKAGRYWWLVEKMLCIIEERRRRHFWDALTLVSRKKERLSCMERGNDREWVRGAWLECSCGHKWGADGGGGWSVSVSTHSKVLQKEVCPAKKECTDWQGASQTAFKLQDKVKVWGCFQVCQNYNWVLLNWRLAEQLHPVEPQASLSSDIEAENVLYEYYLLMNLPSSLLLIWFTFQQSFLKR